MADSALALAKKLGIKSWYRVLILHTPPGLVDAITPLPDNVTISEQPGGRYDLVMAVFRSRAEVDQHGRQALGAVKAGGLLWLCYPKQTSLSKSELHRDTGWDALQEAGRDGVSLISIDSTWSAMRFRPSGDIKSRASRAHDAEK